jgi:hypothetical protein
MQVRVPADVVLLSLEPAGSRSDRPVVGCACTAPKEATHSRCPTSLKRRARRFQLHLGKARRASRISIRWRAGRGRRYRVSTSDGGSKFRRAGVARIKKNGRGLVRFHPRRVGCVRLAQVDRRPPAAGAISPRNLRIGGGRKRRGAR